jgi:hypothetical protein
MAVRKHNGGRSGKVECMEKRLDRSRAESTRKEVDDKAKGFG